MIPEQAFEGSHALENLSRTNAAYPKRFYLLAAAFTRHTGEKCNSSSSKQHTLPSWWNRPAHGQENQRFSGTQIINTFHDDGWTTQNTPACSPRRFRELTVQWSYFEIIIRVRQVRSQEGLAGRIGDIFLWQPFFQTPLLGSSGAQYSTPGMLFVPYLLLPSNAAI